jgi:hypothetical protein
MSEGTFWRALRARARDPSLFHIVACSARPGVFAYVVSLENTYFPPSIPKRNHQFQLHVGNWEDLAWIIVSIPADKRRFAERTAARTDMRLCDAIPCFITADQPTRWFPVSGPLVRYLQNAPDSPVYEGFEGVARARVQEAGEMGRIMRETRRSVEDN